MRLPARIRILSGPNVGAGHWIRNQTKNYITQLHMNERNVTASYQNDTFKLAKTTNPRIDLRNDETEKNGKSRIKITGRNTEKNKTGKSG